MHTLKKIFLFSSLLLTINPTTLIHAEEGIIKAEPGAMSEAIRESGNEHIQFLEEVEGATNFKPIYTDNYEEVAHTKGYESDKKPNTLTVEGFDFDFVDLKGNTGIYEDYDEMYQIIEQNRAVQVGMNGMNAFFGHYYDLSGNGIFNPLHDQGLLHEGSLITVTDKDGMAKDYQITQIVTFLQPDQDMYFYNEDDLVYLPYYGNGDDMVYIQYCRWDIALGQLVTAIGYRVN